MSAIPIQQWHDRAACAGEEDLMDHIDDPLATKLAFTYCESCPVIHQCRQWVETEPDFVGIAAGKVYSGALGRGRIARQRRAS